MTAVQRCYLEDHLIFMCLQTESKELGLCVFRQALQPANVGDIAYSPLWRIQATTWKDPSHAEFLTSLAQITSAAQAGKISTNIAGVVINCPFVDVHV